MSTTTCVSPVSGVPVRLADQAKGLAECRRCLASSPPSRGVSLANPLANTVADLLLYLNDYAHASLSVHPVAVDHFRTVSLGICAIRAAVRPELRCGVPVSDRERPLVTGANGTLMAR
jgi:hypothetical protein